MKLIFVVCFLLPMVWMQSACSVLSVADAVVSTGAAVVSTGASVVSGAVGAVLPTKK
ncbi:MAG: hypothetical protein WCH96_11345 [Betaproteobacteria bacterium]|jgi:hypothetical protein